MTSLGAAGVRGSHRPVRPAEGGASFLTAAVSSPVAPLQQACCYLLFRDLAFTHEQAKALAAAGYGVTEWRWLP